MSGRRTGAELRLPAGFHADLFYDGTLGGNNSPRTMALAPNGDVFVVSSGGSTLYVLRDANGDGKAEGFFTFATPADGLRQPFGIAFHEGFLYVGNTDAVVRLPYEPSAWASSSHGRGRKHSRQRILGRAVPGSSIPRNKRRASDSH
jgi:glucose/arabinose dehydrogenase